MVDKPISDAERLRAFMNRGGMRAAREAASGEVYSVSGVERVRETAAGGTTLVGQLLAPWLSGGKDVAQRVKLTARQRAVGNTYGAYFELAHTGGGSEFMKIKVDTSTTNGGGITERQVQMLRMVDVARAALIGLPAVRYDLGAVRANVGRHAHIRADRLCDAVCVYGLTLTTIGLHSGWITERRDARTGRLATVVPDRQRKALAEALRGCLDAIDAAWDAKGYSLPYEFMSVDVR